jgi:hypothetical protein
MRIFVTEADSSVGFAVVGSLLGAGHDVLGLVSSYASADALRNLGASVLWGTLIDLDALRAGAAQVDGVIHPGLRADPSDHAEVRRHQLALAVLGAELAGSGGMLAFASDAESDPWPPGWRATAGYPRTTEGQVLALARRGVLVHAARFAAFVDPHEAATVLCREAFRRAPYRTAALHAASGSAASGSAGVAERVEVAG